MSDRKVYEDEYQFPNDSYVSDANSHQSNDFHHEPESAAVTSGPKTRVGNLLQNRRFVMIGGFFVVMLIAFLWMTHGAQPKMVKTKEVPSVSAAEDQQLAKAAMMNSEFVAMKSQSTAQQQKIEQLQLQVNQLQSVLSQHLDQESQMNSNMNEMMDKMQTLSNELSGMTKKKKQGGPRIVFHIQAIQPGRAWIEDNKGKDITVRSGDSIPQYGRVKLIDSDHGIITTSSGRTINFGSNDS